MDKSILINIIIILVLALLLYFIYRNQKNAYTQEIKNLKLQIITSLEEANDSHRKYLNETVVQLEAASEEKLEMQEQKYLEDINEKDKYINNLYKMSMSRGEILTYQLLREIKHELISENIIHDAEMIILNNIFIPYLDNQQKTVRQIDHLIVLPTGVFIIETKHLKDIIIHGLTKESLGQYASFLEALFPNEESNIEKTFVIESQSKLPHSQKEIKIIDQKNPALEVKKTAQILTSYLKEKLEFDQLIKPLVYFNYSESENNRVINYSELKDIPIFTERNEVSHYFKDQLTIHERVFEIEDMLEIKQIIDEFNDQKSFDFK